MRWKLLWWNCIFLAITPSEEADLKKLSNKENSEIWSCCGGLAACGNEKVMKGQGGDLWGDSASQMKNAAEKDMQKPNEVKRRGKRSVDEEKPWKWAVHLHYNFVGADGSRDLGNCAGSLISRRHVLTAAHCFVKSEVCEKPLWSGAASKADIERTIRRPENWMVHYHGKCLNITGASCRKADEKSKQVAVKTVIVPKKYGHTNCTKNDIAIAVLANEVGFLDDISCLPRKNAKISSSYSVCGWGENPAKYMMMTSLKRIKMHKKECATRVAANGSEYICVSEQQRHHICQGDSGAGLTFRRVPSGTTNVVGVASHGTPCDLIKLAIDLKDRGDESEFVKLEGAAFTDVRKYAEFVCEYTGLCSSDIPAVGMFNPDTKTGSHAVKHTDAVVV